jgi:hypothetical protein
MPTFSDALFSLEYINRDLDAAEVQRRLNKVGISSIPQEIRQYIEIGTLYGAVTDMSTKNTSTTITNTGVGGIIAGGNVAGSNATVTQTTNSAPADLEKLLAPFADVLASSGMPVSRQNLLKSQLDILREEGAKKPGDRDGDGIKRALGDIKAAAGAVSAVKELWDKFGDGITNWFGSSGLTI